MLKCVWLIFGEIYILFCGYRLEGATGAIQASRSAETACSCLLIWLCHETGSLSRFYNVDSRYWVSEDGGVIVGGFFVFCVFFKSTADKRTLNYGNVRVPHQVRVL